MRNQARRLVDQLRTNSLVTKVRECNSIPSWINELITDRRNYADLRNMEEPVTCFILTKRSLLGLCSGSRVIGGNSQRFGSRLGYCGTD